MSTDDDADLAEMLRTISGWGEPDDTRALSELVPARSPSQLEPPPPRRAWWLVAAAIAVIVAGIGAVLVGTRSDTRVSDTVETIPDAGTPGSIVLAERTTECPTPAPPDATADTYPANEELPPVTGVDIMRVIAARAPESIDSDGDGAADEVLRRTDLADPVGVTRADGTLVLMTSVPGATVGGLTGLGDIDGDGRDELAVTVDVGSSDGPTFVESRIVPGTVGPGEVDVSAVGSSFGGLLTTSVDGLAPDEVLLTAPASDAMTSASAVVRREDLRAVLGGGELHPALQLPGTFVGWTESAAGRSLVTLESLVESNGAPTGIVVRIGGATWCRAFTTGPSPARAPAGPDLQVLTSSAGTDVVLRISDRSGGTSYLWRDPDWQP